MQSRTTAELNAVIARLTADLANANKLAEWWRHASKGWQDNYVAANKEVQRYKRLLYPDACEKDDLTVAEGGAGDE